MSMEGFKMHRDDEIPKSLDANPSLVSVLERLRARMLENKAKGDEVPKDEPLITQTEADASTHVPTFVRRDAEKHARRNPAGTSQD